MKGGGGILAWRASLFSGLTNKVDEILYKLYCCISPRDIYSCCTCWSCIWLALAIGKSICATTGVAMLFQISPYFSSLLFVWGIFIWAQNVNVDRLIHLAGEYDGLDWTSSDRPICADPVSESDHRMWSGLVSSQSLLSPDSRP
jgi:hypothetical protein